jgi:glycerol-3-phosphate dehydrogenase
MPICTAVAAILSGHADVDAAIAGLLSRPLRNES